MNSTIIPYDTKKLIYQVYLQLKDYLSSKTQDEPGTFPSKSLQSNLGSLILIYSKEQKSNFRTALIGFSKEYLNLKKEISEKESKTKIYEIFRKLYIAIFSNPEIFSILDSNPLLNTDDKLVLSLNPNDQIFPAPNDNPRFPNGSLILGRNDNGHPYSVSLGICNEIEIFWYELEPLDDFLLLKGIS